MKSFLARVVLLTLATTSGCSDTSNTANVQSTGSEAKSSRVLASSPTEAVVHSGTSRSRDPLFNLHSTGMPVKMGIRPKHLKGGALKLHLDVTVNAPIDLQWTYSYVLTQRDVGTVTRFGPSSTRTALGGTSKLAANRVFLETIDLPVLSDGYYSLDYGVVVAAPAGAGLARDATFDSLFFFMRYQGKYYHVDNLTEWYAGKAHNAREFVYAR